MPSRTQIGNGPGSLYPHRRPADSVPLTEDHVRRQVPVMPGERKDDRVAWQRPASVQKRVATGTEPPIVLPDVRQILALVAPVLVAALSLGAAFAMTVFGFSSPAFILPMVVPGIVLGAFGGAGAAYRWRASVSVNLATLLILFPLLIIRQSTVRVPYLDFVHGTVFAAVLSTAAVLVALVGLAVAVAWISREDPESSAILFVPAAMLVPLLTSATEFADLQSALLVAGLIFMIAAVLTLLASMMPAQYVVFLAPLAVAIEVLFVTLVRQDRIFPIGVNETGMALFATVVVASIAMVVMLPSVSAWMSQVDRYRQRMISGDGTAIAA